LPHIGSCRPPWGNYPYTLPANDAAADKGNIMVIKEFTVYRGCDYVKHDRIGKSCGVDGHKDVVTIDDGRLVDRNSSARSTGHVRAHAAVADE